MGKTRLGTVAIVFFVIAFLCISISFITSSWLVTDGKLENPKFENLGLWTVCFRNMDDIRHWHDTKFSACHWVYQQEYYVMHEFLLPGYYVAVQFLFSICYVLLILAALMILSYVMSSRAAENFICMLSILGSGLLIAGFCGAVACVIFGVYGDARSWMPHWNHNYMGYSFWVACAGAAFTFIAGLCFSMESRQSNIKRTNYFYE